MYSVYALGDPRTNQIRYIGIALNVYKRFAEHLNHPHPNEEKNAWMDEIKEAGIAPTLAILEANLNKPAAHEREKYWTQHYASLGMPLTNLAPKPIISLEGKKVFCIQEVADRFGLSERAVYRYVQSGVLKARKVGRSWRFEEEDIEAFIEEQRRKRRVIYCSEPFPG